MPLILAEELDTLTVQGIQEWDRQAGDGTRIYIDVVDKCNLTHERLERLKFLVRQRDESSESGGVNPDELGAKLRQISPRRSTSPSDAPSTPVTAGAELTEDELNEHRRNSAFQRYQELKDIGGRPSHEMNPDPGPCPDWKSEIDRKYHDSDYWYNENSQRGYEITKWLDFRWYQYRMRKGPKKFYQYTEAVYRYQQEKGFKWAVELQLDRQTKLDEWREYYIFEHRKRGALEKELEQVKAKLEPLKEQMREAEQNGSIGVPETALLWRYKEMNEYTRKISRLQKEVEMAQKRLEAARVEESLSSTEGNTLTKRAEEEVVFAEERLEAEKSDEIEQLHKESDRHLAQSNLLICQGKLNGVNQRLASLDTLLERIAGQFPEVAAEYASSGWEGRHNYHLLDGWEKYYVYMRERMRAVLNRHLTWSIPIIKGTEVEEAMCDSLDPQERQRLLKTLLAWIESEFPQIAAKHAPAVQDSHSNDHQAVLPSPKPSPVGTARKASPSGLLENKTRRKTKLTRERSPLSQLQPSKVSKQPRRKRPLDQKRSTACDRAPPPHSRETNVEQISKQERPVVAVRKSERTYQRTCNPAAPMSPNLVCATTKKSPCCSDSVLRRSARILNRTEKLRSLGSNTNATPSLSSATAGQKPRRRTTAQTNTVYTGTPQGISKKRHRKATSKGKNG